VLLAAIPPHLRMVCQATTWCAYGVHTLLPALGGHLGCSWVTKMRRQSITAAANTLLEVATVTVVRSGRKCAVVIITICMRMVCLWWPVLSRMGWLQLGFIVPVGCAAMTATWALGVYRKRAAPLSRHAPSCPRPSIPHAAHPTGQAQLGCSTRIEDCPRCSSTGIRDSPWVSTVR
jgi:hypothetical protein